MEELRIPTQAVEVVVYTDRGEQLSGWFYVPVGVEPAGPKGPVLNLLNDERSFVPFRVAVSEEGTSRSIVLHKDHIVRVHMSAPDATGDTVEDPVILDDGALGPVTVDLSEGSRLCGALLVETPPAASRVVDKLNQRQRFVPLMSDVGIDLIHRRHILRAE